MTIEDRLEKVERELARATRRNRRLLIGFLALSVFTVLFLVIAPATPILAGPGPQNEIRSSRFILEDANGKERGDLSLTEDGPVLRLKGENGKDRVALYVHDKAGLNLNNENGKARVALGVLREMPCIFLYDDKDDSRISLLVQKKGPIFRLYDDEHQPIPIH